MNVLIRPKSFYYIRTTFVWWRGS